MKWCPGCSKQLPVQSFGQNRSHSDGLASYCRPCKKRIDAEGYKARSEHHRTLTREWARQARIRCSKFLFEYLASHPCVDCGESDPIVLEFDHVTGIKLNHVSEFNRNASTIKLRNEITKCEVRCANCHRRKTAKERGWFRFTQAAVA